MVRFLHVVSLLGICLLFPLAISAQSASQLAGTNWVLRQYAVQRAAPVSAAAQPATMNFSTDGRVTGTTGCNSYGGNYTESNDQLMVGQIVSTLIACLDNDIAKQDQLVLRVLQAGTLAMTLQDTQLTLSAPAGELIFDRAAVPLQPGITPQLPSTGSSPSDRSALLAFALVALVLGMWAHAAARRQPRTR